MSEFAGYSPERRERDLDLMKHPERWPNNPFYLKRWKDGKMEHGTLHYAGGWFTFYDDFGLRKSAGKVLCDELVFAGWVAD